MLHFFSNINTQKMYTEKANIKIKNAVNITIKNCIFFLRCIDNKLKLKKKSIDIVSKRSDAS